GRPSVSEYGTTLQGDHTADEQRKDAGHQEAGIPDFEELLVNLAPLTKCPGQSLQRQPQQNQHFANVLEHTRPTAAQSLMQTWTAGQGADKTNASACRQGRIDTGLIQTRASTFWIP